MKIKSKLTEMEESQEDLLKRWSKEPVYSEDEKPEETPDYGIGPSYQTNSALEKQNEYLSQLEEFLSYLKNPEDMKEELDEIKGLMQQLLFLGLNTSYSLRVSIKSSESCKLEYMLSTQKMTEEALQQPVQYNIMLIVYNGEQIQNQNMHLNLEKQVYNIVNQINVEQSSPNYIIQTQREKEVPSTAYAEQKTKKKYQKPAMKTMKKAAYEQKPPQKTKKSYTAPKQNYKQKKAEKNYMTLNKSYAKQKKEQNYVKPQQNYHHKPKQKSNYAKLDKNYQNRLPKTYNKETPARTSYQKNPRQSYGRNLARAMPNNYGIRSQPSCGNYARAQSNYSSPKNARNLGYSHMKPKYSRKNSFSPKSNPMSFSRMARGAASKGTAKAK